MKTVNEALEFFERSEAVGVESVKCGKALAEFVRKVQGGCVMGRVHKRADGSIGVLVTLEGMRLEDGAALFAGADAALAERALQPEEGQVPVARVTGASMPDTIDWLTNPEKLPVGTNLYASQLALPAGPVPAQDDVEAKVRALLWNDYPICCGNFQSGEWHMGMREPDQCCGSPDRDMLGDADVVKALRDLFPEQPTAPSPAVAQPVADEREDPIRELIALHANELEGNDYAYFELARHRRTDWMAWICTNVIDSDPNRKVLAKGQGDTPDEACAAAVADYRARAALCQPAEEGGKS
jgi:hypothetical protein